MNDPHDSLPRVTVATAVVRDGELLFVEEVCEREGLVLNQPAGHLDPGETLLQAAVRETLEETRWSIALTHLVGVYQWRTPEGQEFVRIGFAAEPLQHHPERTLDHGIQRALWLTPTGLRAERHRLRSPLVEALVDDWLAGARYPLHMARAINA